MTKVITAPEGLELDDYKVFLAGAIDMGDAVNWQEKAIKLLADHANMVLFNPRRKKFTEDTLNEQISWELKAMYHSDAILMWFPKEAEAPISFLETGLYMESGKLILGAEHGFYRRRNLELTSSFYNVKLWDRLEDLTTEVVRRYNNR